MSKAPSFSSSVQLSSNGSREELQRLVEVLSDHECSHLLNAVREVAEGERFWETDFGLFYNEYIKLRSTKIGAYARSRALEKESEFFPFHLPPKSYPAAPKVELAPSGSVDATLEQALRHRRSRREYEDRALPMAQLSTLLQHACGVTGDVAAYGTERLSLRSFPSHGGLQSPELYVAVRSVDAIRAGIYHYQPIGHTLESLQVGDFSRELLAAAYDEEYVARAAIVFVIAGCYDRLRWKYGERAYRFICMDAGFVAQNVYLVAEALGLGACAVSGFAQDSVERLLGIDGKEEIALLMLTVGLRADE